MFLFDFDKEFYNFTRPVKDISPHEIIRRDDQVIIVHNALGVDSDDIKVDVNKLYGKHYLTLFGETKNSVSGKNYSFNSRFLIDVDSVKDVEWEVKDGLLYVTLQYKEPQAQQVKITRKDKMYLTEGK